MRQLHGLRVHAQRLLHGLLRRATTVAAIDPLHFDCDVGSLRILCAFHGFARVLRLAPLRLANHLRHPPLHHHRRPSASAGRARAQ